MKPLLKGPLAAPFALRKLLPTLDPPPVSPAPVLWTPGRLGEVASGWFDADDANSITLNATTVASWANKGGAGGTATRASASDQPTYQQLGGRQVLNFAPGTSRGLLTATPLVFSTAIFVLNSASNNFVDYATLFSGPGAAGVERVAGWSGRNMLYDSTSWASQARVNGATTATATLLPLPLSIVRFAGTSIRQQTGIGYNTAIAGRAWGGQIGEALFLNNPTDAQCVLVEGYLAWRWGLQGSLPSNHTYKAKAPQA